MPGGVVPAHRAGLLVVDNCRCSGGVDRTYRHFVSSRTRNRIWSLIAEDETSMGASVRQGLSKTILHAAPSSGGIQRMLSRQSAGEISAESTLLRILGSQGIVTRWQGPGAGE
jgi:hypothetical protein